MKRTPATGTLGLAKWRSWRPRGGGSLAGKHDDGPEGRLLFAATLLVFEAVLLGLAPVVALLLVVVAGPDRIGQRDDGEDDFDDDDHQVALGAGVDHQPGGEAHHDQCGADGYQAVAGERGAGFRHHLAESDRVQRNRDGDAEESDPQGGQPHGVEVHEEHNLPFL